MKRRQLEKLGLPGDLARIAKWLISDAPHHDLTHAEARARVAAIAKDPEPHIDDPYFGDLAKAMRRRLIADERAKLGPQLQDPPAPWKQWVDDLDPKCVEQMKQACRLPVVVGAALMPDAQLDFGLPSGGVLATDNAVIPNAVGMDIACGMKLSVFDLPVGALTGQRDRLERAIEVETRFGAGAEFQGRPRAHDVLDEDWDISPITKQHKDKAHRQLGTSGGGSHFAEFGVLTITGDSNASDSAAGERNANEPATGELALAPGEYLALLTHSGSRGVGAAVASYYSRLAADLHPELPRDLRELAWLELDEMEGQEYWQAMELMGRYAAANHALMHHHIARQLGADVIAGVENHHNFAWKEEHDGREVIVHRKGATPAGDGVLGVIPGSMASPGFVVRGKGSPAALRSASHGAGRVMSRTQARQTYRWSQVRDLLDQQGVDLISAGIDEAPFVYKDIHGVMANQTDLVDIIAQFDPKLVKMAPEGERPED